MNRAFILAFSLIGFGVALHGDEVLLPTSNEVKEGAQKSKPEQISVVWEGAFMDLFAMSYVNRVMTAELSKIPTLKLTCVGPYNLRKEEAHLAELQEMLTRLNHHVPTDAQITVRHAWPPNWNPPPKGKWVLMQPWEFGTLPEEWVKKLPAVDEVWVPTHFVKRQYVDSGVPEAKVFVIPNGIDPMKFHPDVKPYSLDTKKKFKFLYVGGTLERKGPDILLNAYLKAFTADDDVVLVIKDFGAKGNYKGYGYGEKIRQAQTKPNGPEIIYMDDDMELDEVIGLYTACDCFVSAYRGEGFALTVLEAMACGLPVLVTDGGATDDFVNDRFGWKIPSKVKSIGPMHGFTKLIKDGWILEPDVEALSKQMRWIVNNPSELAVKGRAASGSARKDWTWQKAAALANARIKVLTASHGL